jgi:hypothetical protein
MYVVYMYCKYECLHVLSLDNPTVYVVYVCMYVRMPSTSVCMCVYCSMCPNCGVAVRDIFWPSEVSPSAGLLYHGGGADYPRAHLVLRARMDCSILQVESQQVLYVCPKWLYRWFLVTSAGG